jgi:hypothetical protein
LRLLMDMTRRLRQDEFEEREKKIEELVKRELIKGTIILYGRRLLYNHFKSQGYLVTQ